MYTQVKDSLQVIGNQLDNNIFPYVKNGGIVLPSDKVVTSETLGTENQNVPERKRRSETRPWQGPARWQRPTRRSRKTSHTAPVICTSLQERYREELKVVDEAYPNALVWQQTEGIWLLTESNLLPGLQKKAIFLTAIPYFNRATARGWGFWSYPLMSPVWIGPRHTNFPDGSICAFEPRDGTWNLGDPIVKLIDLYSLWALRHLHLQTYGRWPGYQSVSHPYERLLELKEDEYCGCDHSDQLYGQCCRENDLNRDRVADAINFKLKYGGGLRNPPDDIVRFIAEKTDPPSISRLLSIQ